MRTFINYISIIIISLVLFSYVNANNIDSPFSDISFTTAKELAAVEGKMVYIDFYANWCVPCKWMDETTYSDKKIISSLTQDFIPVKINIDDFDGYTLKEEYNVKVLPTVIILDENGRVVKRFEESLPPSKLKDVLDKISSGKQVNDNSREFNASPSVLIDDNNNPENSQTVETNQISYRVQVGVFSDYANTEKMLTKLYNSFNEPVVVLTDYLNNKTVYKVYVGDFPTMEEAEKLKSEIERKLGIKCIIKTFE
ncbi:MAG: SPOR domain-containing protein [Deltaproteobacteria bacterium]